MFRTLRYRLIDLARGTHALTLLDELRRLQFASPEALANRDAAALRDYFTALHRSLTLFAGVQRFADLPVLDKRFVQTHREDLMNPAYRGRLVRKKTGGSTGEPLVYFSSSEAQSYLWAGIFLAWEAAGWQLGERVAFLAGSSLFGGAGWKQRLYYRLLNVRPLSAFDLSASRLAEHLAALERGDARLLYGYAAAIHRLARHLLEEGRVARTSLRAVVCTAEVLTPTMRADIEAAFGVPCFSQYGCNDAGVSAFECERREGFHLISPRCHAEVLDDSRFVSTDLANRAMFMPRYDTGDRVRMSGRRCACGRGLPLIDEVLGRQNDAVVDPAGNITHSEFFTHLFREDARIASFQVTFSARRMRVNLHGTRDAAEQAAMSALYGARIRQSLQFERFELVFNQPFVQLANAKHRFVMRVPEDDAGVAASA